MVLINLYIGSKLFCTGGRRIESEVRGGVRDKSDKVVDHSNTCVVLI